MFTGGYDLDFDPWPHFPGIFACSVLWVSPPLRLSSRQEPEAVSTWGADAALGGVQQARACRMQRRYAYRFWRIASNQKPCSRVYIYIYIHIVYTSKDDFGGTLVLVCRFGYVATQISPTYPGSNPGPDSNVAAFRPAGHDVLWLWRTVPGFIWGLSTFSSSGVLENSETILRLWAIPFFWVPREGKEHHAFQGSFPQKPARSKLHSP